MNKRELLDRTGADGEERLLLGQVLDKMEHAQRRQEPCATGFLSPKEQRSAEALLNAAGHPRYAAVGGYDGAERRVLVFLPDWMEPEYLQSGDYLSVLRCTWFKEDKLTHRDFLGSLMGMGVRRDTVGDILVGDGSCDILILPTVAGFLKDSLTSAGRVKLHVSEVPLEEVRVPVQERKVLHDTVAALRLDSVLAVGFSISRSKASQLIASGRCAVNWQDTSKSDLAVRAGEAPCERSAAGGSARAGAGAEGAPRHRGRPAAGQCAGGGVLHQPEQGLPAHRLRPVRRQLAGHLQERSGRPGGGRDLLPGTGQVQARRGGKPEPQGPHQCDGGAVSVRLLNLGFLFGRAKSKPASSQRRTQSLPLEGKVARRAG